jgi:hypothetical protein
LPNSATAIITASVCAINLSGILYAAPVGRSADSETKTAEVAKASRGGRDPRKNALVFDLGGQLCKAEIAPPRRPRMPLTPRSGDEFHASRL